MSELRQQPGTTTTHERNPNEKGTLDMRSSTWHAEDSLLLLMSGGFFVHLINASRHLRDDGSQVADILLRPVDLALFLLMAHCWYPPPAPTGRSRASEGAAEQRLTSTPSPTAS
jgi:hypothetical protein